MLRPLPPTYTTKVFVPKNPPVLLFSVAVIVACPAPTAKTGIVAVRAVVTRDATGVVAVFDSLLTLTAAVLLELHSTVQLSGLAREVETDATRVSEPEVGMLVLPDIKYTRVR